jgi:fibronectin-binding autotransporter adhesin
LGDSSNTLLWFNNSGAFGSGGITFNRTANYSTLLNYSGTSLTLANNFSTVVANTGANTGINFASSANSPVVSSGTWSLGTVNLVLKNSGGPTSPLTLSGAISGSGGLIVTANTANSHVILSAVNSYTGPTTVAGTGYSFGGTASGAAGYLTLGIANAIASSSSVIMAGGTLDPDGFLHTMRSTTLGLTANSTIDFTSGGTVSTPTEIDLANSAAQTWTAATTLNLLYQTGNSDNWNSSGDALQIGADVTGLTAGQLGQIEFNGADLGDAEISSQGYIYDSHYAIPEPSTVVLGLLGGLGILCGIRRRAV